MTRSHPDGARPTGRSMRFYAPLRDDMDVEAIAQRVAQQCAIALQRQEADAVQVVVQEAQTVERGGDDEL